MKWSPFKHHWVGSLKRHLFGNNQVPNCLCFGWNLLQQFQNTPSCVIDSAWAPSGWFTERNIKPIERLLINTIVKSRSLIPGNRGFASLTWWGFVLTDASGFGLAWWEASHVPNGMRRVESVETHRKVDCRWPASGFFAHGNLRGVCNLHVHSLLHPLIYWEMEGQKDESNRMGPGRKIWLGGMDRGMDLGYCLKMKKNRASNALIAPRKPTCTHAITVSFKKQRMDFQ